MNINFIWIEIIKSNENVISHAIWGFWKRFSMISEKIM